MDDMYKKKFKVAPHLHTYMGRLVIPPKYAMEAMSRSELEDLYHKYVENIQLPCRFMVHFGRETDGGYYFCKDVRLAPPCMMYSFGTRNDYSFDDKIANVVGCDVHSFDPGDGQNDHKRSIRVWFHKIGLGGYSRVTGNSSKWHIYSLQDTRKLLGHTNRSLDILKIDTEGSLWETLANISYPGVIDDVKLLIFEAHTQIPRPLIYFRSKDDYIEHLTSLRRLYDLGFRIYYVQRWAMCTIKDDNGEIRTGCHDIHFIQTKFLI